MHRLIKRATVACSAGLLFTVAGFTQTPTGTSTAATSSEDRIDKLINSATSKVIKQLNGVIPDNLRERVQKELNRQLTSENRQKLLERLDSNIPEHLKNKLPQNLFNSLGGIKVTKIENVNYAAGLNNPSQQMNVYLPPMKGLRFPLIIYVHGGGWQARPSKVPSWINNFVKEGYAVACVNYRLSGEAPFPAQIEDLNTALRFLKQNAAKINVDPERIGLFGLSAGGNLAALMGTGWNAPAIDAGGDKSVSRKVTAVADWYGPSDLYALGTKTYSGNKWDLYSPTAPLSLFLGGQAATRKAQADAASPITYVSAGCPPFLIMHGTNDNIIPVEQSRDFAAALKKAGCDVSFIELPGVGHGFQDKKNLDQVRLFFNKHLNPSKP